MALMREKGLVEREELKTKGKIEKEQVKERIRMEEDENKTPKDKGKPSESPLVTAVVTSETDQPASSEGQGATATGRRASTVSSESLRDSSDEDERPRTDKSAENNAIVSPRSPSKRQSKVKSWFAGRFRSSSKAAKDGVDTSTNEPGFIGGASLTGASPVADEGDGKHKDGSVRDVAMAGRLPPVHTLVTKPTTDLPISPVMKSREGRASGSSSTSTLSDSGVESSNKKQEPRRGRLGFKARLLGKTNAKASNDTDNEDFEEARDMFEEEQLTPPPKLTAASVASKASGSPVRDSRFSENL